jgi:hypothetical protein
MSSGGRWMRGSQCVPFLPAKSPDRDQLTSHGWLVHEHAEEVLTRKLANGSWPA